MTSGTTEGNGWSLTTLNGDAMADCPACDMPLMPVDLEEDLVILECANRHRAKASAPTDRGAQRLVHHWISKRGAQIHTQHERWAAEEEGDET